MNILRVFINGMIGVILLFGFVFIGWAVFKCFFESTGND